MHKATPQAQARIKVGGILRRHEVGRMQVAAAGVNNADRNTAEVRRTPRERPEVKRAKLRIQEEEQWAGQANPNQLELEP